MFKRNKIIAKISSVVITITLVAILLSQIQLIDIITTLAGIDPLYLIAGFVLYVCSDFFRALRFHILLNGEVGLRDLFNIVCVHNMVNNILLSLLGFNILRVRYMPVRNIFYTIQDKIMEKKLII